MVRISDGAKALGVEVVDNPNSPWRPLDIFTTHNGSWENTGSSVYSVPVWARTKYLNPDFDDAGADHHVMVRTEDKSGAPIAQVIHFRTSNFDQFVNTDEKKSKWANLPIYNYAEPGDPGPWRHGPRGAGHVRGGGLPKGEHVSLFVVWVYDPDPGPDGDTVTVNIVRPTTLVVNNKTNQPLVVLLNGAKTWTT